MASQARAGDAKAAAVRPVPRGYVIHPGPALGASAPSLPDRPRPKHAGLHDRCHNTLFGGGGPSLQGEPQCSGYAADTHCRSDLGLGRADRASR